MRLTTVSAFIGFSASIVSAYDNIIAFADSYTDNGNDFANSGFPPSPPYFEGRFTNGPTWLEYVAKKISLPVTNVGHGGATTNNADVYSEFNGWTVPGLLQQIENIHVEGSSDSLFVIEIGYNDLNAIINPDQYKVVNKNLTYQKIAENTAKSVNAIIKKYKAKHFLVFNVAPFDRMPVANESQKPAAKKLINDYNAYVTSELKKIKDADIKCYDLHGWFEKAIDNYGQLGYKDTSYCAVGIGNTTACSNPGDHFFWDYYHPEAKVHKAWGEWAIGILKNDYNIN